MKVIEKIALIIYSNIILILSVIACLMIFRWLDINTVFELVKILLLGETSAKIILLVCIAFILLSIRCIFFDPIAKKEQKEKQGIMLENENGKLMISKETIENLVDSITKEFNEAKEVNSTVNLDKNNNINISVKLTVREDVSIKELSTDLQTKIKDRVKNSADLDVKEVNIIIKKIAPVSTLTKNEKSEA